MTPSAEIKPEPHWCKTALSTRPTLPPNIIKQSISVLIQDDDHNILERGQNAIASNNLLGIEHTIF